MEQSVIHFAEEVFVALIHAYAAYGEFEKAKQVCAKYICCLSTVSLSE